MQGYVASVAAIVQKVAELFCLMIKAWIFAWLLLSMKQLQSRQLKRTPQDSINELIILCYENFSVFRRIENIWMDEIS